METPRLILTPVAMEDIGDLVLLYGDPYVAFWTGPWSREGVEAWTLGMVTRWQVDGVGKWMARTRDDGSLVGRGGFTRFDLASIHRGGRREWLNFTAWLVGGLVVFVRRASLSGCSCSWLRRRRLVSWVRRRVVRRRG